MLVCGQLPYPSTTRRSPQTSCLCQAYAQHARTICVRSPSDKCRFTYWALIFWMRRWEWFTSLEFDLQFFTGKREFRWPMVSVYSVCCSWNHLTRRRYSTLRIDTPCSSPSLACVCNNFPPSPFHKLIEGRRTISLNVTRYLFICLHMSPKADRWHRI